MPGRRGTGLWDPFLAGRLFLPVHSWPSFASSGFTFTTGWEGFNLFQSEKMGSSLALEEDECGDIFSRPDDGGAALAIVEIWVNRQVYPTAYEWRAPISWISMRLPNGSWTKNRRQGTGRPSSIAMPAECNLARSASTSAHSRPKWR